MSRIRVKFTLPNKKEMCDDFFTVSNISGSYVIGWDRKLYLETWDYGNLGEKIPLTYSRKHLTDFSDFIIFNSDHETYHAVFENGVLKELKHEVFD